MNNLFDAIFALSTYIAWYRFGWSRDGGDSPERRSAWLASEGFAAFQHSYKPCGQCKYCSIR